MIQFRVYALNHPLDLYQKLAKWVGKTRGAYFDKGGGVSWYNGTAYYATLIVSSKEDAIVCKLLFGDYIL